MAGFIRQTLTRCPTCIAHSRQIDRAPMGEMPLPSSPMQIVGMDLIGPFVPSIYHNRYMLTIICHATGWAEVYPLQDKSNASVWRAFANHFLPQHGPPEVIISDNGCEFLSYDWQRYLQQLGIEHPRITAAHPQSNGKIERFHHTFKEALSKAVKNDPASWEGHIAVVLYAHRISTSTVTGYSPYFLMYGRRPRAPLSRLLPAHAEGIPLGNRLDSLATTLAEAKQNTADSRHYNRECLAKRSRGGNIKVGDHVVIKSLDPVTFTTCWDPHWLVTRISGSTCFLHCQVTGHTKKLHRDHVKLVDPDLAWDEVPPRPRRQQRHNLHLQVINPPVILPPVNHNEAAFQNSPNAPSSPQVTPNPSNPAEKTQNPQNNVLHFSSNLQPPNNYNKTVPSTSSDNSVTHSININSPRSNKERCSTPSNDHSDNKADPTIDQSNSTHDPHSPPCINNTVKRPLTPSPPPIRRSSTRNAKRVCYDLLANNTHPLL